LFHISSEIRKLFGAKENTKNQRLMRPRPRPQRLYSTHGGLRRRYFVHMSEELCFTIKREQNGADAPPVKVLFALHEAGGGRVGTFHVRYFAVKTPFN
jgi:hypothetical protein